MKEYIEREMLLELYDNTDELNIDNFHVPIGIVRQNILDQPVADVKEVIHAKWEKVGDWDNENNALFDCSNCNHGDIHAEGQEVPYCWYCGAKMDL